MIVKSLRTFVSSSIMQVVVELLSYHNTATHEEVAAVTRLADSEAGTLEAQQLAKLVVHRTGLETVAVVRFSYYGPELEDLCKVQKVLVMFTDLFGTEKFDVKCLVSLCCMVCERFQCSQTPDKVLHHCSEELPRGGVPQLDPRLPRRQQRVRHAQVLLRHLQTARGGTGDEYIFK